MRIAGMANLGYYPTPDRVTAMIASHTGHILHHPVPRSDRDTPATRVALFDPCCGAGDALSQFAHLLLQRVRRIEPNINRDAFRTYGVELHQERARQARKQLTQVWNTDIDNVRIRPQAYHYLWLNPPYDWSGDEDHDGSRRLESRFLHQTTWGLAENGILIYIIPHYILRHDARYLADNYRNLQVYRFPDPEYAEYRQVVVFGWRRQQSLSLPGVARELELMALPGADIPVLDFAETSTIPTIVECLTTGYPVRVMTHSPEEVAQATAADGLWSGREIRQLLSTETDHARIHPIEPLPEGHAAMVAANSMMDNVVIHDPAGLRDPIVLRGFFRKQNRETFRTDRIAVRTDYFESNIRALNTRTGRIDEMGQDPEGLRDFMTAYGPVIQEHIAQAYPPSVDPASPACQAVRERIGRLKRPLVGKQIHAAAIGAAYLKRHRHLNLFFQQGSGKTCTAFAIAYGMSARKVAVMTPTRVVPNWIAEIRAVCPDAIIRVIDNNRPIGTRRLEQNPEQSAPQPAKMGRCSLEEIRRLERYATPERPLWVLLKKDTARSSHPVAHGLRWIGVPEQTEPAFRPLRRLAATERRVGARPMPVSHDRPPSPRLLYRNPDGQLQKLPTDNAPVGTCPKCWYPLTEDENWKPKNRDAVCINPGPGSRANLASDSEDTPPRYAPNRSLPRSGTNAAKRSTVTATMRPAIWPNGSTCWSSTRSRTTRARTRRKAAPPAVWRNGPARHWR